MIHAKYPAPHLAGCTSGYYHSWTRQASADDWCMKVSSAVCSASEVLLLILCTSRDWRSVRIIACFIWLCPSAMMPICGTNENLWLKCDSMKSQPLPWHPLSDKNMKIPLLLLLLSCAAVITLYVPLIASHNILPGCKVVPGSYRLGHFKKLDREAIKKPPVQVIL